MKNLSGPDFQMVTFEDRFRSVEKLVWMLAHKHWSNFPRSGRAILDLEDLFQEGCLALWRVDHQYDPSRSKYTTFVHMVVTRELISLRDSWNAAKRWHVPLSLHAPSPDPEAPSLEELVPDLRHAPTGEVPMADSVIAAWYAE